MEQVYGILSVLTQKKSAGFGKPVVEIWEDMDVLSA